MKNHFVSKSAIFWSWSSQLVRQLAAKTESLPTTGSQESQTISLFGFAFLSIGALFTRKNRRQN